MGCNNSRHILEMESRPIRPVTISSHSVGSVMAPSSIFQDFPETSELSRQQIIDAFQHMAEYLNECGTYVNCAVVGGVVNTLYLRHRETTPDVEFLLHDPASKEYITLSNAASFANKKAQGTLGEQWFNNSMQFFVPRNVQVDILQWAKDQHQVIFEHRGNYGGLTVYAAPWDYALCSKLNSLYDNIRADDMEDAVAYLHRYLTLTRQESLNGNQVNDWCRKYHQDVSREVLNRLGEAYARKHGSWPLQW
ncbi:hypothetical protein FGLOB1_10742 [Fusarium globosum]|uniref:DUF7582 domain-containing protein n=1 Tax=Fusarium globosum TaxID=78864 RepID=A0A8H5XVT6_9HYPO|nr:hypothetical protein FGLOB1_10742 [Fusarium globosum]